MAYSSTSTKTETFTRIFGIRNQFKIAFERLMSYSSKQCEPYLEAIKSNAINSISYWAYAFDETGEREKWCELVLFVDWDKYDHFLLESKNEVILNKNWDGIVPEVDVDIDMIENAVKEFNLNITFSVRFVDNISSKDYTYYMKHLGLMEGKKVKWRSGARSVFKASPKELSELSAEVFAAENLL